MALFRRVALGVELTLYCGPTVRMRMGAVLLVFDSVIDRCLYLRIAWELLI